MSFVFDNLRVFGKKRILWQTTEDTWANTGYYETNGKWGGTDTLAPESENAGSFVFEENKINN